MKSSFSIDIHVVLAIALAAPMACAVARAQAPTSDQDPAAAPVDRTIESGPSGDTARREARVRFQMGVSLFEEGDYQGALAEFERANASAPSPVVLYNIAQTHLALRDYVAAVDALHAYLEMGGTRLNAERRAEVEAQLAVLTRRIGRIRITCNEDGASVTIDGRPLGRTPIVEPIRLSSGRHQIVLRVPEREPYEQELTLAGNTEVEVEVEFPPPPPREVVEVEESHTLRTVGWVGMGTGIAGGAAAIAMLGLTVRAQGDYEDATAVVPADERAARAARDDVHRFSLAADILAGASIAIGGTGLVLFLLDRKNDDEDDATAPSVSVAPSRNGLTVFGRF